MVTDAHRQLIGHVTALMAETGFEGLSVRAVAARAGVSIGAVQHHFPTKDAMLRAAAEAVVTHASEHYASLVDSVTDPGQQLRAVVDGLLPDGPDDVAARVWLALAARAVFDQDLRELHATTTRRIRRGIAMAIAAATGRAEDADREATELLALVDGLTVSVLSEASVGAATARAVAQRRLDAMLAR